MIKRTFIYLFILAVAIAVPSVMSGQYFDLGPSASSIKWKQIKTDNYRYVFDENYEENAVKFAKYLDAIYPAIGTGFRYGAMKLPIAMHTQNFASNGMVMMAPKRMELITVPNVNTYTTPWMKQLAVHELRHAVQFNNMNRNFMKGVSYVVGQQGILVGALFFPMWALEGDAVMIETQMTTYGRGLQPSFSMPLRAIVNDMKTAESW